MSHLQSLLNPDSRRKEGPRFAVDTEDSPQISSSGSPEDSSSEEIDELEDDQLDSDLEDEDEEEDLESEGDDGPLPVPTLRPVGEHFINTMAEQAQSRSDDGHASSLPNPPLSVENGKGISSIYPRPTQPVKERRRLEKHDRKIDLGIHDHIAHPECPDTLACLPDTNGRPQHTLPVILRCAILGSPRKRLTIREIYATMEAKYPYYKNAGQTWKQSVRHHLSLNRLFERQPRPVTDPGFGSYWTVNLAAPPGTKRPRKRGRPNRDSEAGASAPTPTPRKPAAPKLIIPNVQRMPPMQGVIMPPAKIQFQFQPQTHPTPPPPPMIDTPGPLTKIVSHHRFKESIHTPPPPPPPPEPQPQPQKQQPKPTQPPSQEATRPPRPPPNNPSQPQTLQARSKPAQTHPQPRPPSPPQLPLSYPNPSRPPPSQSQSQHPPSPGRHPQALPHQHHYRHHVPYQHVPSQHSSRSHLPQSQPPQPNPTYYKQLRQPAPPIASSSRREATYPPSSETDDNAFSHKEDNGPTISDEDEDEDSDDNADMIRHDHQRSSNSKPFVPTQPSALFSLPPFSALDQNRDDIIEHMRREIALLRRTSAEAVSTSIRLSEQLANANLEVSRSREAVRDLEDMLEDELSKRKEAERNQEIEAERRRAAEHAASNLNIHPSTGRIRGVFTNAPS